MTRLALAVEMRFWRVPTDWTIRTEQLRGELAACPSIRADAESAIVEVDGFELRRKFLQMRHTPESAIAFLSEVGVWSAYEDPTGPVSVPVEAVAANGSVPLNIAFRSRLFHGRALPIFLSELWREQTMWLEGLRNISRLKEQFGPPPGITARPIERLRYAAETKFFNEMPLHIEWRKGGPFAAINTLTATEMLIAATHVDLLCGAKFANCKRKDCGIPYPVTSRHKRKYCSWDCGHIVAVRNSRKPKKGR